MKKSAMKFYWVMVASFLCFAGINVNAQSKPSSFSNDSKGSVVLGAKVTSNDLVTYTVSIPAMDKAFITQAESSRSPLFQSLQFNETKHEVVVVMKNNAMSDEALIKIFQGIELKQLCPNYPSFASSGGGPSMQFTNDFDNWKNKYPGEYASYLSIFNLNKQK